MFEKTATQFDTKPGQIKDRGQALASYRCSIVVSCFANAARYFSTEILRVNMYAQGRIQGSIALASTIKPVFLLLGYLKNAHASYGGTEQYLRIMAEYAEAFRSKF